MEVLGDGQHAIDIDRVAECVHGDQCANNAARIAIYALPAVDFPDALQMFAQGEVATQREFKELYYQAAIRLQDSLCKVVSTLGSHRRIRAAQNSRSEALPKPR